MKIVDQNAWTEHLGKCGRCVVSEPNDTTLMHKDANGKVQALVIYPKYVLTGSKVYVIREDDQ